MSKKNRNKFRDRPVARPASEASHVPVAVSPSTNSPVRGAAAGAMAVHTAEYRIISKDLIRLIVLNGLMLAAVLVVYFTNRSSGYLERIFQNLF